jgi:hypothetical protein
MIVRLLSIAKAIMRTCTPSGPAGFSRRLGCGSSLRLNNFRQVNPGEGALNSVAAQLSSSKGAWFHEDEGRC